MNKEELNVELENITDLFDEVIEKQKKGEMPFNAGAYVVESYFYVEKNLYKIVITWSGKIGYSPYQLNGSHKELIVNNIENFIKNKTGESNLHDVEYNYSKNESFLICLHITRIKKLIISTEIKAHLETKIIEKRIELEKEAKSKNKEKLYNIIDKSIQGLALRELIQKTRFFKDPEERKEKLNELINAGRITTQIDINSRRGKKVYKSL